MRHAKAEPAGTSDADRRLTAAGLSDAASAGAWLAASGLAPDHAVVSAAVRTTQTWEALAAAAGWSLAPELDQGLYSAGPETALDIVRGTDDAVGTLLVLGHNPTVAYLAAMLDDGDGEPDAVAAMTAGYPTCALTVFSYAGAWAGLAEGSARVDTFHVARG
jgi:phosphohistidine phosphatase